MNPPLKLLMPLRIPELAPSLGRIIVPRRLLDPVAAWSIVHGLAALLVDGKLKSHVTTGAEAERLAHTITDCFMLGVAPRA